MRIVRISRVLRPGKDGLSNHVWALSQEQARAGHTVTLLQPQLAGHREGDLEVRQVRLGRWATARIGSKVITAGFALRTLPMVRRQHDRRPVDVIHCHGDVIEAAIVG
jgi:hypothetical protein